MVDVEPGAGQPYDDDWRFTAGSCTRLFGDVFDEHATTVHSYGNVLSSMAFLTGRSSEELSRRQLDDRDPYFPMLLAIRAVKGVGPGDPR